MVGKLFNDLLIDKLRFYINDTDFDINNRAAFLANIKRLCLHIIQIMHIGLIQADKE